MSELPDCSCLALRRDGWILHVTLNRPKARNAMSFAMVEELDAVFDVIADEPTIRAVTVRGSEGHFCAGGDIKDMAKLRAQAREENAPDPLSAGNRRFGALLQKIDGARQAVIALLEGTVMGGGFGLACVSDVAIACEGTRFRLPETSLGVPPAQIAPFIVRRIGLTQARRLAVTGGTIGPQAALGIGLIHEVADTAANLDAARDRVLQDISKCAPNALAMTKAMMLDAAESLDLDRLLDAGSDAFAQAARSDEGAEGMVSFIQKRKPRWDDHVAPDFIVEDSN